MDRIQIKNLEAWAKRFQINEGPKKRVRLYSFMEEIYKRGAYNPELSYKDYREQVHPVLFFLCLGKWESIAASVPTTEVKRANKEWIKECYSNKSWKTSEFDNYTSFDTFKKDLKEVKSSEYSDFKALAQRLRDLQQARLDATNKALEEQINDLEDAKYMAELKGDSREIAKISTDLRRVKAQQTVEQFKQNTSTNNEPQMESKKNLPFGGLMDTLQKLSVDSEPASFLAFPYPLPEAKQMVVVPSKFGDSKFNLIQIGVNAAVEVSKMKFTRFRFTRDPKDGQLVIYFGDNLPEPYGQLKTEVVNNSLDIIINNEDAVGIICFEKGYSPTRDGNGDFFKCEMSDNISTSPAILAYRIL